MKNRFCIIIIQFLLLLSFAYSSHAQWYDPEKVNKKARDIYYRAYEKAVDGLYTESINLLDEALKADPRFVEVYLSRAGIHADMKNYAGSVLDFEKAFSLDSVFSATYLLPYSISLAGTGQFEPALEKVNRFLQTPGLNQQSIRSGQYRKSVYAFAVQYKELHPDGDYSFSPENLGDSVNSINLEYFPSLTIDGKKIIFTRRVNNDEDFYESELADGVWSKATPLSGKINTNFNEGAQNISQDGTWLVFTGCNYPEGRGSCDLYISYLAKNGKWTEPENMGSRINTEFWESSPSLSPDKKDLYFSSNRTGGYGGKDIWVSHKQPNGSWSEPENLGPDVNTDGDEGCPFMHADNETLYFNSNGHIGYGMTDLFLVKKINDSTWGKALNLGYPINSIDDEGSLVVTSDGMTSYYASDKSDSKGGLDLYKFQLRKDIRASKTTWVKGKVFNKKNGEGLPSTVELTETNTRKIISRLQTDEDGNYLVTLPAGKEYAFNVNRKGFLFYSDHFVIEPGVKDSSYLVDIPLQPIETGAAIVLKNIFFDSKQSELKPSSLMELDKVVQLMNENPSMKIMISGHTDHVGRKEDNLALSLQRAKAVTSYLAGKGIEVSRLTPKGFGDSKPLAPNDTEQGKSLNRRTELNVISIR